MCNNRYGSRGYGLRHEHFARQNDGTGSYRVPVNIVKAESSYEVLVFAPDRAKEDFKINLKGQELTISYQLKSEPAENRNWIRHEFRKTSFERTFIINETIDTEAIRAEYVNGILQLILPIIPGSEKPEQEISVS